MHDIRFIRENPQVFDAGLDRRGLAPASADILKIDEERRAVSTEMQQLQQRRNDASREIGSKRKQGENADALMQEVSSIKENLAVLEEKEKQLGEKLGHMMMELPNLLDEAVPQGADEESNRLVRAHGEKPRFDFAARDHVAIGENLGMMDFTSAAKLSGARFVVLRDGLAKLERAIAAFMLDTHCREFGYTECLPPALVRPETMAGTGQLPKFEEDLFQTSDGRWLIPTAEVPLTNMVAGDILAATDLPLRMTAYTPCFRAEAGAAGRDTRGMIRQHQFSKVELVSITHPDESDAELERMTNCAETILQRLGLAYQVMMLCSGDTGFSARRTYDLEVWLPGQNDGAGQYREISSCSNCGEFQARRMRARFRDEGSKDTRFVHTLNGSGLAVGRTMIAILENYQQEDGSVLIPEVLRSYMLGLERLQPASMKA